MALSATNFGENPQQPSATANAFIPDQLIAGNLKLVTDNALITGSAILQRGSVLGRVADGSVVTSAGTVAASGTVLVAALPAAGDTLTIGGTVVTFVAANPVGNQVLIGATAAATAQNLVNFLIGSADVNLVKFGYSLSSATVTLTAIQWGTGGNSLAMLTSNAVAFTLSGATLASGAANTGNATIGTVSLGSAAQLGAYKAVCLTATTAQVYAPNGTELGVLTFGTAFTDPQITFTITAGATPCVAGDTFILVSSAGSGSYKLAVASATDGSQIPDAILADYADASAGDVNAGIYIMGEFNILAMTFGPGITVAAAKGTLRNKGIFLKTAVSAADPL